MLLTETRRRALIYDILLEGVREDAAALEVDLEDNPEALRKFQSLSTKPKWVNWLADRYLRRKYPVDDTLPDVLPLVVNFASKDAAIGTKYGSNEQFKAAVDTAFPPESRFWQNPSDVTKMTSSDMNTLLALHDRKKQRIEVDRADESWKSDKIGQFGPWALYFPTNQQNSVNIAGADPVTLKGYTTWCTAQTAGSNLFYNYAGRGIMLFYALDESKPPTDPKGRISLGYENGVLNVSGEDGHVTVDARNRGLKMPALRRIFGSHLSGILAAAEAVVEHHGAEHPAKAEIAAATRDVVKFKSMLSGLSDDEAADLCEHIFGDGTKTVSLDVLIVAASHKSAGVRAFVAYNESTPPHLLEKLASDPDAEVRATVARDKKTPSHVLEKLADDSEVGVRAAVAKNKSTPPHFLEKLAADPDARVRANVAHDLRVPSHFLEKLAADPDASVRLAIVKDHRRRKMPAHVLEKLADDTNARVREAVAENLSTTPHFLELRAGRGASVRAAFAGSEPTPTHILEKLAADPEARVREVIAHNESTPPHLLEMLASDPDAGVRATVSGNESTPLHVFEKLADDPEAGVRRWVALSVKASPRILEKLADDPSEDVCSCVARNPKTPLSALRALAQHKDKKTREAAQATLAKLQPMGEARRLAHRIITELKRR